MQIWIAQLVFICPVQSRKYVCDVVFVLFSFWIRNIMKYSIFSFHIVSLSLGLSWSPILCLWKDDILWVSDDVDTHLQSVITQLPQGWHLCYLGWHGQSVLHLALGEKPTTKPIEVEDLHFGVQPGGLLACFTCCFYILCGDMYRTCCFFLLSLAGR